MNTNQLKKFAQEARRKLMAQVGAKLEYVLNTDSAELREKARQVQALREELARTGKVQLIEKVAYTWFNRLMALRFMDANDFQPSGIRILSPKDGFTLPQLLDEAKQGNFPEEILVDKHRLLDLLDGRIPSTNPQNEAYRLLLIAACNSLNRQFPFLFEKINDYTELLLPDDLTSEFSIVHDVAKGMPTDDCQQVEIIGWLYQFYISEKKDEVFASKDKVKKEDIPAATQLFTPRWIVEYMVQNTLGKLWLQNRPNSRLREHMPYFIESASPQTGEYLYISSPEEITLLDQACGSGHILVYAFELLTKIYEEDGYAPADIPRLILEKNLYGFEIDGRAAQLSSLALLMKARSYYRRLFRKAVPVPQILQFEDVTFREGELENYLRQVKLDMFSQDLLTDLRQFEQATNYGSLMRIRTQDLPHLQRELPTPDIFLLDTHHKVHSAFRQMELLSRKFHCVVDNPPYMGGGNMNPKLAEYVKTHYPESKADLMTCFMEAGMYALKPCGFMGMINLPSWLFLSSFENLRKNFIKKYHFESLLHMGRGIFGIDWGSTAFIVWNNKSHADALYFKLHKRNFQHIYPEDIRDIFLKAKGNDSVKINFDKYREGTGIKSIEELIADDGLRVAFTANQKDFEKIPGSPIGYWVENWVIEAYENLDSISAYAKPSKGMMPGPNFIRFHWEIEKNNVAIGVKTHSESKACSQKWYPYFKGGAFRKWYGNREYVVDFYKDGQNPKMANYGERNPKYYFKNQINWSKISSGQFSARSGTIGGLYDDAACQCPVNNDKHFYYLLGYLNSKISRILLTTISPTLNYSPGEIAKIPVPNPSNYSDLITPQTSNCELLSKQDWNSRETSWDFSQSELLHLRGQDLEESYDLYCQYWTKKFHQLHRNEEELNRQFIEIYGLQDELTPEVPLEDITILKEETRIENGQLVFDAQEVMAQFVSYAVGCMMGRYALDKEGLILANQGETLADFIDKVGKAKVELTFAPDEDAIIPILDDEWFEDDIVGRFQKFLKSAFGERDFRRNLAFLETHLGKDIRKYFIKDFYTDHLQRYKKRPIYWLFSSPKGTFNVLVYLHRYTPDTLNNILNHYLREFIQKLRAQRAHFEQVKISGSTAEQNQAIKRIDQLDKMLLDCEQYERDILFPLATERIALDLDDGVLVNYNKLGQAVKEVSGLNDKATKKKVRGFEWADTASIK